MTVVPDQTLQWLYTNLKPQYHYVDRVYSELVSIITRQSTLSPKTDIYTFDDGSSALLVLLYGTLPIPFRGTEYRYPVTIWIPYAYPREPPIIYVTPTQAMAVRPGQHVSIEGRVYHPYLAQWPNHRQPPSLQDVVHILVDAFAKEPPVMSQPTTQNRTEDPMQFQQSRTPPVGPSHIAQDRSREQDHQSHPPPRPPKRSDAGQDDTSYSSSLQDRPMVADRRTAASPPVLPPKPGQMSSSTGSSYNPGSGADASRYGSLAIPSQRDDRRQGPPLPQLPAQVGRPWQQAVNGTSASNPDKQSAYPQRAVPGVDPRAYHPQQQLYSRQPEGPSQFPQARKNAQVPLESAVGDPRRSQPKKPVEDLMSSSLEVTLPSQSNTEMPAPPIPPNPEKDALLQAISQALIGQLHQITSQNLGAIPSLEAQNTAMQQAYQKMSSELAQLQSLDSMLTSNEKILHETMREADKQLDSVRRKEKPNVDEVLVAPTVVGEQLYGLVADEKAIGDALFALTRALDKGRVAADVFLKQTRSLAREQYLKKALIKKIATGMGLDTV